MGQDEALSALDAAVTRLFEAGLVPSDNGHAVELIRRLEHVGRRFDAVQVEVLAELEESRAYSDEHTSAKVMVRHHGVLSGTEANRRASMRRALRSLPEVREAYQRGEIGSCQVRRLATAHGNKRVRGQLVVCQKLMLEWATDSDYKEFDALVTDWVRFVDEDGSRDRNQINHENRRARGRPGLRRLVLDRGGLRVDAGLHDQGDLRPVLRRRVPC